MQKWNDRPAEIANLFNPGYCAQIIYLSIRNYFHCKYQGMPLSLVYLIIPIVLHKKTRDALPKTTNAKIHPWILKNEYLKIDFGSRIKGMKVFTNEALILLLRSNAISIDDKGYFRPSNKKLKTNNYPIDSEEFDCFQKAKFVGRWLSKSHSISSIYLLWGIKP